MTTNKLYPIARKLRKSMTLPERLLWQQLKLRLDDGIVFRRQYPFENYVFDFYCAKAKLIIEIDGWTHNMGNQPQKDRIRDEYLLGKGFKIMRYEAKSILDNPVEIADNIRRYCSQFAIAKPPP